MYLKIFFFLALAHISLSTLSDHPKLVIEIFRHGARSPIVHHNDPYWKGERGELTKIGRAQHLVLGASLIQKYPHLKEVLDHPARMYLQSTQMNRTIESLQFHLWGMYHSDNISLDDLNIYEYNFYKNYIEHKAYEHFYVSNRSEIMAFAPTKTHITPLNEEYELLTMDLFSCPNMDVLVHQETAEEVAYIMSKIGEQIQQLNETTPTTDLIYHLYDLHYANLYEGTHSEELFSVDSAYWNHLKHGAEYMIGQHKWGSDFLRKLNGMPLFHKILNFLEQSHENKLPYDLVLLSAHDVTVFNLLAALGITDPKCFMSKLRGEKVSHHCSFPNFASQVLVELWERNGEPSVRILYEKEIVNLCGTENGECLLSEIKEMFARNFASLTLEEILKHCGRPICNSNGEEMSTDNLCHTRINFRSD